MREGWDHSKSVLLEGRSYDKKVVVARYSRHNWNAVPAYRKAHVSHPSPDRVYAFANPDVALRIA